MLIDRLGGSQKRVSTYAIRMVFILPTSQKRFSSWIDYTDWPLSVNERIDHNNVTEDQEMNEFY